MYILSVHMWFQNLIRQFFFSIDKVIYSFIPTIYNLLIDVARTSILSQADIASIATRIYQLLAIFMVFKVTFSLIMYVVNPDDFSDKSKGVSKLGVNIVIALSLLVLTPYVFSYAYQLQTIILEDDSLGTLVFGDVDTNDKSAFSTAGNNIAFITLQPFLIPNLSIPKLGNCITLTKNGKFNKECSGIDLDEDEIYIEGSEDSLAGIANDEETNSNFRTDDIANYVYGVENKNLGLMFRQEIVLATAELPDATSSETESKSQQYMFDYKFIFSTAVGVMVIVLLISFSMDVAIRSVKLSFLQLIAPIPILSYIDPKSGKDGMFKKWYQLCFKTYVSIFVRLLSLYFGMFIISKIDKISDVVNGSYQSSLVVKIFVIIGVLMFIKQLPKILEGLGIKLDGDGKFTLNPLKKFENEAFGGKRIAGAAGAMVSSLADRGARIATARGAMGKLKAAGGAPFGLAGAAFRGFRSNAGFSGGVGRQADVNRRLRESRMKGLSPVSAYLDYAGSQFGLDDATLEREGTLIQQNKDALSAANKRIASEVRANELEIAQEQQNLKGIKSIESRRNTVKSAAEKLQSSAESFASKKADFKRSAQDLEKTEAIRKMRNGDVLTAAEQNFLRNQGIDTSSSADAIQRDLQLAKLERNVNKNQYTTNRRTDAANLEYLKNNQGVTLDRSIVIGEGDSQLALSAGTKIDGSIVAQAESAQGRYIKTSQKEVFNELAKAENSQYKDVADYQSFQNDYNVYESAKETANQEMVVYSGSNPYNISLGNFDTGTRDYDSLDKTINEIKSGTDTTNISTKINESTSKIESKERQNSEIKAAETVVYYDEKGRKVEKTLAEAESELKPREESYKSNKEKHQERRTLLQSMASNKK